MTPKPKASTRGNRFTDRRQLRAATRAYCEARFAELAGYPWGENDKCALVDDIAESPALDRWRALEQAVVDAREWLEAHSEVSDGYAARLRRAVAALPEVQQATPSMRWTRRKLLVMEYDSPQRWWWRARRPKPRELAVLSLLAGEFPEWALTRLSKKIAVTVLEVVAAEERAVRQAIRQSRANHTLKGSSAVSS